MSTGKWLCVRREGQKLIGTVFHTYANYIAVGKRIRNAPLALAKFHIAFNTLLCT